MAGVREIVTKGLAQRAAAGIKVKQPLSSFKIQQKRGQTPLWGLDPQLLDLVKEELNVKEVVLSKSLKQEVVLDTTITPVLRREGLVRELQRVIQNMRKEAGYKPQDRIRLRYTGDAELVSLIEKNIQSMAELFQGDRQKQVFDLEKEISLEGKKLWLGIRKL